MAAYTIKVEADLTGSTAFGATRTWTDVTTSVLSTGVGEPIDIQNWRSDQNSDMSPSAMDITIDNTAGTFKPGATGMTPLSSYWRVTATISGTSSPLFDGVLLSAVASYVGGIKPVTKIHCVDVLAIFGRRTPLRSLVVEEMLLDSPSAFYPLNDPTGAASAGDITTTNPPAVVTNSKYGAGTLAFGAETSILGQSGAVSFTSPDAGVASTLTARATYLSAPNALPATDAAGFSVAIWFLGPSAHPAVAEEVFYLPPRVAGGHGVIGLAIGSSGVLNWIVDGSLFSLNTAGTTDVCNGLWHCALITLTAGGTATLYLDGVSESSVAHGSSFGWNNPTTSFALGVLVAPSNISLPLNSSLALFAQYPTALSSARAVAHRSAGLNGFAGESIGTHIVRLLAYRANFGSILGTAAGTIGQQDTDGVTLADALAACGKAEVGAVFINGSAQVVFFSRNRLFNPATGLTLNASNAGEVTTGIEPRIDDQGVVNDVTITRPFGADRRAFDAASIALYGSNATSEARIVNSDQAAFDIANDIVAQGKTPTVDTQSITCDITAIASITQANAVLSRAPLDHIKVINLPSTSPPVEGTVQGRHITIGADKVFSVTFLLSPLRPAVMVADDAVLGICDTVNVAGF